MSQHDGSRNSESFRLPQLGRILEHPAIAAFIPELSRPLTAHIVRSTLQGFRDRRSSDGNPAEAPTEAMVIARCTAALHKAVSRRIRPVINATGILLHTNLGRAPLPRSAWDAAEAVNTGYSNLEFDLESGERGSRGGLAPELAACLAGTESALIVNNNAAALLLALSVLAAGREVVISRGEQVQIGGGFRIPEILALSGARLVEVGTTNVTTVADYLGAITEATACVLVVHSSNFAIRGFTSKPTLRELREALPAALPILADQGSGCSTERIPGEMQLRSWIDEGASLVCFSGDKLLGGPQAGILAGKAGLVDRCRRHPLMRALRPGKTVLSLLESCLLARLSGAPSPAAAPDIKTLRRLGLAILGSLARETGCDTTSHTDSIQSDTSPSSGIGPDAGRLRFDMGAEGRTKLGFELVLVDSEASSGGGTGPDTGWPSLAVELHIASARRADSTWETKNTNPKPDPESQDRLVRVLATALRRGKIPVVGILKKSALRLDLSTMTNVEPGLLARLVLEAAMSMAAGEQAPSLEGS